MREKQLSYCCLLTARDNEYSEHRWKIERHERFPSTIVRMETLKRLEKASGEYWRHRDYRDRLYVHFL